MTDISLPVETATPTAADTVIGVQEGVVKQFPNAGQAAMAFQHHGIRASSDYASIQDAIDAATGGEVLIVRPPTGFLHESFEVRGYSGGVIRSQGANSRITSTGEAHTVLISESDWALQDIWVDHGGVGDWDAICSNTEETRIRNVDVDLAPRYGINLMGVRSQIESCQVLVANVGFVRLGGSYSTISNFIGLGNNSVPAGVVFLTIDGSSCSVSSTTLNNIPVSGVGVLVNGNSNQVTAQVSTGGTDSVGVKVKGSSNSISGAYLVAGANSIGAHVLAANNHLSGRYQGGLYGIKIGGDNGVGQTNGHVSARGDTALYIGANCHNNCVQGSFLGATKAAEIAGYRNMVGGQFSGLTLVSGGWNCLSGVFGNVEVTNSNNVISGTINGNLTISGSNNRILARVSGTITNTGGGNVFA